MNIHDVLNPHLEEMNLLFPTPINCGGCGIFASEFSKRLTEVGIEHKILSVYTGFYGFIAHQSFLDWLNFKIPPQLVKVEHFVVQIGEFYYDSTGIILPVEVASYIFTYKYECSFQQLGVLIDEVRWNSEFDRGFVPQLQQSLDVIFSTLKTYMSCKQIKKEKLPQSEELLPQSKQ